MSVELFAGVSVSDYRVALEWYGNLFGGPPTFLPNDIEAVWEIAEHRYVYIQLRPEHAGHALLALVVDDLDERVAGMAERGVEPWKRETYDNGVRKITYQDPDGNELGFAGVPVEDPAAGTSR